MIDLDVAEPTIAIVSNTTARKFRGYVERDDIAQELRMWLLDGEYPNRQEWICELSAFEPQDRDTFIKRVRQLRSRLADVADRYARNEKAARCGYRPEDEQFYARRNLAGLVEIFLNGGVYQPPTADGEQVSGLSNPAESGTMLAMLADLDRVWADLADEHERVLVARFNTSTLEECAAVMAAEGEEPLSTTTVWRKEQRALDALIDLLGGHSPYGAREDYDLVV